MSEPNFKRAFIWEDRDGRLLLCADEARGKRHKYCTANLDTLLDLQQAELLKRILADLQATVEKAFDG